MFDYQHYRSTHNMSLLKRTVSWGTTPMWLRRELWVTCTNVNMNDWKILPGSDTTILYPPYFYMHLWTIVRIGQFTQSSVYSEAVRTHVDWTQADVRISAVIIKLTESNDAIHTTHKSVHACAAWMASLLSMSSITAYQHIHARLSETCISTRSVNGP